MSEPLYLCHCGSDTFRKGSNLALEINEEGIRSPTAHNFDGAVGDAGKVEGHGTSGAEGVGANFVRVEPQLLEANLCGVEAEEGGDLAAVDTMRSVVDVVSAYGGVWWGVVTAEVEITVGGGYHWVTKGYTGSFHGGGFTADTVLLCIQKVCDGPRRKEGVIRGIVRNNTLRVGELHVLVTELDCTAMG